MERAKHYAIRFSESDMSLASLTALFEAAMREGANRERARCIRAAVAAYRKAADADEMAEFTSWELTDCLLASIDRTKEVSPLTGLNLIGRYD